MASEQENLVADLVAYFVDEARRSGSATSNLRRSPPRRLLADLLTVRQPGPLPQTVLDGLDTLLQTESAARGIVDAASLPNMSDQGLSRRPSASRIALWLGDLTVLRADAIVNAANSAMLGCFLPGHACIDNSIHAWAGPALRQECATYMSMRGTAEPTGSAVLTDGYNLPARAVIHTVGPIVRTVAPSEEDRRLLGSCYFSVLDLAHAKGLSTVGFCAISTGVFGYPKDAGARVALTTVLEWLDAHLETTVRPIISAYTPADLEHYLSAVPR